MKIGLIGYGKMGKAVEAAALKKGHAVVACLSSKNLDYLALQEADICIDFSASEAVLPAAQALSQLKKNLVIGTTGWEEHLPLVKRLAENSQMGILFAPNFSIGMFLFKELLQKADQLLGSFDAVGIEMHHSQKKDLPSGTAKELSKALNRKLAFSSIRSGNMIGTHQILFNSQDDMIELTHRALNREGFARGAVEAAEWLLGKAGFFTMEDFMREKKCS